MDHNRNGTMNGSEFNLVGHWNSTNQTNNNTVNCDFEDISRIAASLVPVCFGLICITGLLGNILVIVFVLTRIVQRSFTNILILNLAVADLLFVIFCVPFTATDYVLESWPFGELWCKLVQYFIFVTVHASIYTLVLLSLERYLAVVLPFRAKSICTVRNAWRNIGIIWSIILTSAVPVFMAHVLDGDSNLIDSDLVYCRFNTNDFNYTVYNIIFFVTAYFMPLIVITVLYLVMISRLWREVQGREMSSESYRARRKVTRMIIFIVVAFATLWFPIQIILLLKSLNLYETCTRTELIIQIISHVMAYTSSCVNPILYAFLSGHFRQAFSKVFSYLKLRPRNDDILARGRHHRIPPSVAK